MPFVSRTRAIFRSAEFGFLGVIVDTRVQTPRFCGAPWSAGVLVFSRLVSRPLRISWLTVGMSPLVGGKRSYTDERPAGHSALPHQGRMVAKPRRRGPGAFGTPASPGTLTKVARNWDSGRAPRPALGGVRPLDQGDDRRAGGSVRPRPRRGARTGRGAGLV